MTNGTGSDLGEILEQLPGVAVLADKRPSSNADAPTIPPPDDRRPAAPEPRTPLARPAVPRPSEAAYRYALDLVRYEGGDLESAPPAVCDTIRRWRDWQRYDDAMALRVGADQTGRTTDAGSAGVTSRGVPSSPSVQTTGLHPDWSLIIDDLLPDLYAHWQPVIVPQVGHPRHGIPHVANADGTRLSTHITLWAARHGHGYGWARRLLHMAEQVGLIRYVTYRPGGMQAGSWSQWVPLDPDAYARRLEEVLSTLDLPSAATDPSFG